MNKLPPEQELVIKQMAAGYADAKMRMEHRLIWGSYFDKAQNLLTEWCKDSGDIQAIEKFKTRLFGIPQELRDRPLADEQ